jgi:hypothetical protein
MSEETTQEQVDEGQKPQTDEHRKAQEAEERHERARATMEELEKDPPKKLEDWPDDEAKYETFRGSDTESDYDDQHEEALGQHSVRHHDDGSVEVKGEKVDNPDEFKGEPIPGGPTDPDAPAMPGEEKTREAAAQKREGADEKQDEE